MIKAVFDLAYFDQVMFDEASPTYPISTSSGLSLASSLAPSFAFVRSVSRNLSAAASVARSRNRAYTIAPSLTVGTTISRVLAWTRTTASAITAELSIARTYGRLRTVSVGLSAFLTIVNRLANEIAISCGLVVSTSVSLVRGFTRTVAASSTVATTISKLRGWTEVMAASLKLSTAIPTRYEYYTTGEDAVEATYSIVWTAQSFTPSISHTITKVKLKLFRTGSPAGVLTVSIRAIADDKPTGDDLCSGAITCTDLTTDEAGAWETITLGSGCELSADVKYAIVIRAINGNSSNRVYSCADDSNTEPPPAYSGGSWLYSSDSGVSWTVWTAVDLMFEEWGDTPSISRVVGFVRSPASALRSISTFSAVWSGVTDTLVTIAASLTVATSVAYQWAAKRTVSPSLTLTATISRTVTKTRSVAVSLTAAVSFLINEAVGRALKVITTVSHVFSIKSVVSHAHKIITREGD